MMFLRISSENETAIETIAGQLLKKRLVIDLNIKRNIERWCLENGELKKKQVHLMTSKSKGLLFQKIDALIKSTFPDVLIEIYSVPILHMDWDETRHLETEVQEV